MINKIICQLLNNSVFLSTKMPSLQLFPQNSISSLPFTHVDIVDILATGDIETQTVLYFFQHVLVVLNPQIYGSQVVVFYLS